MFRKQNIPHNNKSFTPLSFNFITKDLENLGNEVFWLFFTIMIIYRLYFVHPKTIPLHSVRRMEAKLWNSRSKVWNLVQNGSVNYRTNSRILPQTGVKLYKKCRWCRYLYRQVKKISLIRLNLNQAKFEVILKRKKGFTYSIISRTARETIFSLNTW